MKNKLLLFYIAFIVFAGAFLFDPFSCTGQETAPINWEFSSEKKGRDSFVIHLKAIVKKPWHTYSQTTPAGGPFPTKITFDKTP